VQQARSPKVVKYKRTRIVVVVLEKGCLRYRRVCWAGSLVAPWVREISPDGDILAILLTINIGSVNYSQSLIYNPDEMRTTFLGSSLDPGKKASQRIPRRAVKAGVVAEGEPT
jgi:flavin-dependent dehydrogenase